MIMEITDLNRPTAVDTLNCACSRRENILVPWLIEIGLVEDAYGQFRLERLTSGIGYLQTDFPFVAPVVLLVIGLRSDVQPLRRIDIYQPFRYRYLGIPDSQCDLCDALHRESLLGHPDDLMPFDYSFCSATEHTAHLSQYSKRACDAVRR